MAALPRGAPTGGFRAYLGGVHRWSRTSLLSTSLSIWLVHWAFGRARRPPLCAAGEGLFSSSACFVLICSTGGIKSLHALLSGSRRLSGALASRSHAMAMVAALLRLLRQQADHHLFAVVSDCKA